MTTAQSSSTNPLQVISSKAIVKRILGAVQESVERHAVSPGLAVILVGSDPASQVYVRNKTVQATACGFNSRQFDLPATTSEAELLALIESMNVDEDIHCRAT